MVNEMTKNRVLGVSLSFFLALFCLCSCGASLDKKLPVSKDASVEGFTVVNEDNPGQEFDIKRAIVYGKYTIIDFSSPGCGACMEMMPYLRRLNEVRPDIVVRSFDVNRPGSPGIDWESPLTVQYHLHSLPELKIFNERGVLMAEGKKGEDMVIQLINKEARNIAQ